MKAATIISTVERVTKKWAKQRKREEREASSALNRTNAMLRSCHVSIREAAWEVMEDAYFKASANGTLPAYTRQVMYAARGSIQELADRPLGNKFDSYFTQTLLPDYIKENNVDWNVVFDARGHFYEPHTEEQVSLGTLEVRDYLHRIDKHEVEDINFSISEKHYPTLGPMNAFGAILFIEKEGFFPLFKQVRLADRYDIAIMSTKGMSVTAARELLDKLCGEHGVPVLVLHDFDKAGFSTIGTLSQDSRRYSFSNTINIIDLGLRLKDVETEGLVSEEVYYDGSPEAVAANLHKNGATAAEIEFLLSKRVELNAFASDQLINWIERKFKKHGIKKVVPDAQTLTDAYWRVRRQAVVQDHIDRALAELGEPNECADPTNLRSRIAKQLKTSPTLRWDDALRDLAEKDHCNEAGDDN